MRASSSQQEDIQIHSFISLVHKENVFYMKEYVVYIKFCIMSQFERTKSWKWGFGSLALCLTKSYELETLERERERERERDSQQMKFTFPVENPCSTFPCQLTKNDYRKSEQDLHRLKIHDFFMEGKLWPDINKQIFHGK